MNEKWLFGIVSAAVGFFVAAIISARGTEREVALMAEAEAVRRETVAEINASLADATAAIERSSEMLVPTARGEGEEELQEAPKSARWVEKETTYDSSALWDDPRTAFSLFRGRRDEFQRFLPERSYQWNARLWRFPDAPDLYERAVINCEAMLLHCYAVEQGLGDRPAREVYEALAAGGYNLDRFDTIGLEDWVLWEEGEDETFLRWTSLLLKQSAEWGAEETLDLYSWRVTQPLPPLEED